MPNTRAPDSPARSQWSSRLTFILAATGSAVGLGNIWKFPYITGEYGGGAFVLVYLACITLLGVPMLIAEVMIGRSGSASPTNSYRNIGKDNNLNRHWSAAGSIGVTAGFLVLCFYSVIGGWSMAYLGYALQGQFTGADNIAISGIFTDLIGSHFTVIGWHSLFMLSSVLVVGFGVNKGIERTVTILMPLMFALLLILVGYAATTPGFNASLSFLFSPDFSKLSAKGVLEALGHAFFTLSLGLAIMLAYGSYLPKHYSIGRTAVTVAFLDTLVALLAGVAIFAVVFSNGLTPDKGPGLVFQTLPLSFGQMPFGNIIGILFFFMLLFAAWSSAISITEPCVSSLMERFNTSRRNAAIIVGLSAWGLGISAALSFNLWAEFKILGLTIFDFLDYLTTNILLPLGCMITALFVGWALPAEKSRAALPQMNEHLFQLWLLVIRFVAPLLITIVFINNMMS